MAPPAQVQVTRRRHATIGGLINTILKVLTGMGYPGIAAVVGLQNAGLPLPGGTTLRAVSYLGLWALVALAAFLILRFVLKRLLNRRWFQ